jgi:hypothetical protein
MIQISCPNCNAALEIDSGFAGGICRCFNCGTLMTVPRDPDTEASEAVRQDDRPDRPDAPPGQAASAKATFVTTSGRTLSLDAQTVNRVPTARRRRVGVRIGVIGGFVVVAIALVVALVALVANLVKESAPPSARQITTETLGYDPQANPFKLDQPNVMGLPMPEGSIIIVVDTGARMTRHLAIVTDMLAGNTATLGADHRLTILLPHETEPLGIPESGLVPADQLVPDDMAEQMAQLLPGGLADILQSVEQALERSPDRLMLITATVPRPNSLARLERLLGQTDAKLDVVLIDSHSRVLTNLAEISGGRYIELPAGQLTQWYQSR